MSRRGWSLVEVLVVLVLTGSLAALVNGVVAGTARSAARQQRALNRERIGSTVAAWWRAGLRDAQNGDVLVPSSGAIDVPLSVGAGAPCGQNADTLRVARSEWLGERDPEPGRDRLWLLRDAATGGWEDVDLVVTGSGRCPDGTPALELLLGRSVDGVELVRAVEPLQLRVYRSAGVAWFGQAPSDGTSPVQPVAGPVEFTSSQFTRDSSGVHVFVQPTSGPGLQFNARLGPP